MGRKVLNWQVFLPTATKTAHTKMAQIFAPHFACAVAAGKISFKHDLSNWVFSRQPFPTSKGKSVFTIPEIGRANTSIPFSALPKFKFQQKKVWCGFAAPRQKAVASPPPFWLFCSI
jgi:hypothetical protein